MSQFGLPDHNDNVLEERIEWDSISIRERRRCCTGNEAPRRTKLETRLPEELHYF